MNTLATRHPASSLSRSAPHARVTGHKDDRQGSLFLLGSLVLHAALLVGFATTPSHARSVHAEELVEISFDALAPEEPPVVEPPRDEPTPEPEAGLPLGQLNAKIGSTSPTPVQPAAKTALEAATPIDAAPEVLTADNPYASENAAVFTSGHGRASAVTRVKTVAAPAASTAPSFGVENGSTNVDEEKARELSSWYAQVRSQLLKIGTSKYPRRAQKLGQQGTTEVRVTVGPTGQLAVQLAAGSGVASLDEAALQRLRAVSTVAAPPAGAGTQHFTLPLTFRLN